MAIEGMALRSSQENGPDPKEEIPAKLILRLKKELYRRVEDKEGSDSCAVDAADAFTSARIIPSAGTSRRTECDMNG